MRNVVLETNTTKGKQALAKAKRRLDEMDGIGLTRDFEQSIRVISWELGIPLLRYCACNVNPFKHFTIAGIRHGALELSRVARRKIMDSNALDVELYRHAQALYHARVARYEAAHTNVPAVQFTCDRQAARCKDLHPRGGHAIWIPIDEYRRNNTAIERQGMHSFCSFSCSRSSSDLGASAAAASSRSR